MARTPREETEPTSPRSLPPHLRYRDILKPGLVRLDASYVQLFLSVPPNLPQVVFKVPDSPASAAARRRKKVKVLEEEEYIDRVEAIIGIRFTNIRHIPICLIL